MKRIFTTTLLLSIAIFASAGNLEIRDAGGNVLNNTTVTHTGNASDIEILAEGYNVYNVGSTSIGVRCKRVELMGVTGVSTALCWSACSPYHVYGATPLLVAPSGAQTMAPGDFRDLFVLHYKPNGNAGLSSFRVVFYDQANPLDSASFIVNFDAAVSVAETAAKPVSVSAYPNPASNMVTFDVANYNEKATLRVTDALGITVKTGQIISGEGDLRLSVADLRSGVYFYSLIGENNKTILTRRLVITR